MPDPSTVSESTELAPATLADNPTSSGIAAAVREQTSLDTAIDRKTLMSQIGHGVPMSAQQRKKLAVKATDDIVSLLPTGEVYVSGTHWRNVLNDAFGPMQWGLVSTKDSVYEPAPPPLRTNDKPGKSMLYLEVFLVVKGTCVATAIGEQEYFPESKRMTKGDAIEGCRTNGLTRCMKQLGVYSNIWDAKWANACRDRVGVKVFVSEGWPKQQWRRLDGKSLEFEIGLVPNSPNAEAYLEQFPQFRRQERSREAPPERQTNQQPRQQAPAPPREEAPVQPDVIESPSTTVDRPEKLLTIRPRPITHPEHGQMMMWIVQTDHDEYVTLDPEVHKALEAIRPHKKRVIITYEQARTKNGTRKRILEFRTVD